MKNTSATINRVTAWLHAIVGVGAAAGGLAAIMDPFTPLGITAAALEHAPFKSFFIPGIFLFAILGGGNIFCAFMYAFKSVARGHAGAALGAVMIAWIAIQCVMLRSVVALHVIFFCVGLAQVILGRYILLRRD